jgi:hypothetical protein
VSAVPSTLSTTPGSRHLLPAMRVLLGAFAVLTALAVGSLFVLATSTEETFAWTIAPPLTAAFIGAGYGAGFLLVVLSLWAATWASVRVALLTIFVFVVLTLAATLIHLDRLHFAREFTGLGILAKGAAWVWFGVYLVVPVAMLVLLVAQERAPGADPAARHPVPVPLRVALGVESAVLFVVGVLLYAVPTSAMTVWPWQLTPFTGRIIAAWLLAFGVATALAAVAGDLERLRTAAVAYTAFGVLVLVAVLRFRGTLDWGSPKSWLFVVVAVAVAATGGLGWRLSPAPLGASRD